MAKASPAVVSFNAGELSPSIRGRTDLDKYSAGCRTLENYLPRVQGPALKRSGFRFVHPVKSAAGLTTTILAEWGEDVRSNGLETPADGNEDLVGTSLDGGIIAPWRVVNRFPTTSIPAGSVITQIQVRINVKGVLNVGSALWRIGPYNGDGLADAEPDSGGTAYSRCNLATDNYGVAFSDYRTTGVKTTDITTAQAIADLTAAANSGADFSICWQQTDESTGTEHYSRFSEYIEASNLQPALLVTFGENRARMIPFEFSTQQAYALEFGNQYMRVFKDNGIVLESPLVITATTNTAPVVVTSNGHGYSNGNEVLIQGTGISSIDGRYWVIAGVTANDFQLVGSTVPGSTSAQGTTTRVYEITTPYLASDLDAIAFAQNADVMYLVHPAYPPQKLSRTGHTAWTMIDAPFDWFPFAPENPVETDFMGASADSGSVTLTWTKGGFTSDYVNSYVRLREIPEAQHAKWDSTADYSTAAYQAFRTGGGGLAVGDRVQLDGRVYELIDLHGATGAGVGKVPPVHEDGQSTDGRVDWKFINYGAGYAKITAVIDAWRATATVIKTLPKSTTTTDQSITAFNSLNPIQLTVAAHGYETGDKIFIRGVSSTRGTALNNQVWTVTRVDANNFTVPTSGVGLAGSGGTSTQVYWASNVNGAASGFTATFPNLNKWSLGAWSVPSGYPRAVSFFEDRLWFAGTNANPQTLWGSRTSRYEDFRETKQDDSALLETLNTNTINVIEWLAGQDQLMIGTPGGEFLLRGGNDEPVTPTNVRSSRKSTDGARSGIQPISIGISVLFVQRAGLKLIELTSDLDTSSLLGVDLTILADHITRGSIRAMAFQREPDRILWVILEDGTLLGFTYERAQQVTGWHRHPVGGTTSKVESVAVIPAPDGASDQLWAVVQTTVGGTPQRFVEFLDPSWQRGSPIAEAFFVDHGLSYVGAPTNSIPGLFHLAGESVDVLADGVSVGPLTVSAGGTLGLSANASQVHAGKAFPATLEPMLLEAGAADGTAQGKIKRVTGVVLRLDQTGDGLFMGPSTTQLTEPVPRTVEGIALGALELMDGDTGYLPWPSGYEQASRIVLQHRSPLPCTVLAIYPNLTVQDR